ncbi:hypothetical protein [Micromonospora siamensis]|uniref:DUF4345 domain-containing protein n=1 Tax=Micromonospora siamensis TaxID=299152 RepID=A0A1C5GQ75_9ACTN|nr:hypothetical protein [Micromonospora siamensis]SCG35958.1 hypothetical protein GA0074704_0294 [Micromonospora siamensis]
MRLPRSGAGWTIAVFGVLAVLLGAFGLVWPEAQLRLLGFQVPAERGPGDYTGTFLMASSMASFNMGVYYLLATATEWRSFFRFTVFFRLVTFTVFSIAVLADVAPGRFFGVALWEGLGAVATAVGLWWDARRPPTGDLSDPTTSAPPGEAVGAPGRPAGGAGSTPSADAVG